MLKVRAAPARQRRVPDPRGRASDRAPARSALRDASVLGAPRDVVAPGAMGQDERARRRAAGGIIVHLTSLKTAAAVATQHGQGIFVVISGVEWRLSSLQVVDKPEDLALCEGYTHAGDLVVFNCEDVDLVRIPVDQDGSRAALPKFRGE